MMKIKKSPKYSDLTREEAILIQRSEKIRKKKTHAIRRKDGNYDVYDVE